MVRRCRFRRRRYWSVPAISFRAGHFRVSFPAISFCAGHDVSFFPPYLSAPNMAGGVITIHSFSSIPSTDHHQSQSPWWPMYLLSPPLPSPESGPPRYCSNLPTALNDEAPTFDYSAERQLEQEDGKTNNSKIGNFNTNASIWPHTFSKEKFNE